jgi:hypothetical protein
MCAVTEKVMQGIRKTIASRLLLIALGLLPLVVIRFGIGPIRTNLPETLIGIAAILVLPEVFALGYRLVQRNYVRFAGALAMALVAILPFITQAASATSALGEVKAFVIVPILAVLMIHALDIPHAKLISAFGFSMVWISILALAQQVPTLQSLLSWGDPQRLTYLAETPARSFGVAESPNFLAMYLVPLVPLLTLVSWRRWYRWAALCICIAACFATVSQAGYLALVTVGLLTIADQKYFASIRIPARVMAGILPIAAFGATFILVPDGGTSARIAIWREAWRITQDNWILGIGSGRFQELAAQSTQAGFAQYALPYALHPHSLVLSLVLAFGILGLIALMFVIVQVFRMRSADAMMRAAAIGLAAVFVHGLFDTPFFRADLALVTVVLVYFAFIPQRR